ncbi:MAG: hypothetical protein FWG88_08970 [Oscillospiraceae bacterium]|nr:hypothetical protein [Oscillospiraceae bacterium]
MRKHKLLLCASCAFVTMVAAITALVIFKKEITEFFMDIKGKIDVKKYRNGEYSEYAEM